MTNQCEHGQLGRSCRECELEAEIEALRAQVEALRVDAERLDWIEAQTNGDRWIARQSSYGRGFRLHNEKGAYRTAREAIDKARP